MWNVKFYERENGDKPAENFLLELNKKVRAKALSQIEELEKYGNKVREPYSKYLKDGIFELRIQTAGEAARVLYFFQIGQNIILTSGFIKKTQKTPPEEIKKALKYKTDYERRFNLK